MNWRWTDYRRLLGEQKNYPKKQRLVLSQTKLKVDMAHNLVSFLANQTAVAFCPFVWGILDSYLVSLEVPE